MTIACRREGWEVVKGAEDLGFVVCGLGFGIWDLNLEPEP